MSANYIDKMREFRGGGSQEAILETPKRKSNPFNITRPYHKSRQLNADLTRHYEGCILSKSAKRFQGARRKAYCAAVAWSIAKKSGLYSDYPGFLKRNSTMAGKSRKKSVAAKRRKRDRSGRFQEPAARRPKKAGARKNPISKAKALARGKRAAATRRYNERCSLSLAKKRKSARARKPAEAKENPVRRKTRKSVRRYVRHSYEPMEQDYENPISQAAANRRGKKSAATRRRNAKLKAAGVVVKPKAKKSKKSGTKRVNYKKRYLSLLSKKKSSGTGKKKNKKSGRPKGSKNKSKSLMIYPATSGVPVMGSGFVASEYGMENPLSGGEMALAFVTGGVGYALTDLLDRYLATDKNASPSMNSVNIITAPSITRMAVQAGVAAVPMALSYWVQAPMGRAVLQGLGFGAGLHLVGQVMKTYVLGKLLKNNTMGIQLLPDVISAEATSLSLSTSPPTAPVLPVGISPPVALAGPPRGMMGAAPYRNLRQDVGPRAGVGAGPAVSSYVRSDGATVFTDVNGQPVSVTFPTNQMNQMNQMNQVFQAPEVDMRTRDIQVAVPESVVIDAVNDVGCVGGCGCGGCGCASCGGGGGGGISKISGGWLAGAPSVITPSAAFPE